MTQPPPGPWRPTGPLPPPAARPLPPRPVGPRPPAHRPGYPNQQPPPYPTQQYPQQQYPQRPPMPPPYAQRPPGYPPPGYQMPPPRTAPWVEGYPGHPQGRPKSNTGAILTTILVGVLVVAVGMVGLIAANDKEDTVADTGYDEPVTTTSETTTTDVTTTTTETTTETEETTYETETETTPAGPQPVYALGDNPLFLGDLGLPAVTCNLATWETSPAGAANFFTSALPCLDAAWAPVMEQAGLPFFTPGLQFPEGTEWSSACGSTSGSNGAVAAFYCGQDNTLYMPFAGLQTDMYGAHPGVYLAVLSHEYGHHVQAMSGVLSTYAEERYNAGADTEPGLELSRRLELQAQCFSGMFFAATYSLGSVDDNILTEARTSQDRGDHTEGLPRDHGTDDHAIGWWEQGAQQNRTWQCNTWLSPPEDVA